MGDLGTETDTTFSFSPEAKAALTTELGFLSDFLIPQQVGANATILDLLKSVGTTGRGGATNPFSQAANRTSNQARSTAGSAASSRGVSSGTAAPALASLEGIDVKLLAAIENLARQTAGGTTSIVNPSFAQFLQPKTESSTAPTSTQVGLDVGLSLLGIGVGAICHIALALYGDDDQRFWLARHYVNNGLRRTLIGRGAHWLYMRFGKHIARCPRLCRLLKPLFDRAWRKGYRDMLTQITNPLSY